MSAFTNYLRLARPGHWFKNIFIVPGILAALGLTGQNAGWRQIFFGMIAACLVASANYVLNEYLDAASDRHHPKKKARPCALDQVSVFGVFTEYLILFVAGLFLALQVSGPFTGVLLSLFVAGILYNVKPFRTKDRLYLDVLSESINNPIRLLLGWYMVTAENFPPVSLLLGYWMAGAFLMAVKRFAEYRYLADPEVAGRYRKSFIHYNEERLLISILFYASASSFFLGVFLVKYKVELILALFSLAALFAWYFHLSFREDSPAQHPERLFREKRFVLYVVLVTILIVLTTLTRIPRLQETLGTPTHYDESGPR